MSFTIKKTRVACFRFFHLDCHLQGVSKDVSNVRDVKRGLTIPKTKVVVDIAEGFYDTHFLQFCVEMMIVSGQVHVAENRCYT